MQRISAWKANSLSLAGKLMLCSSMLTTMPMYSMQTTLLLTPVCTKIASICRRFLWEAIDKRKTHHCNWAQVCKPKFAGGLGLQQAGGLLRMIFFGLEFFTTAISVVMICCLLFELNSVAPTFGKVFAGPDQWQRRMLFGELVMVIELNFGSTDGSLKWIIYYLMLLFLWQKDPQMRNSLNFLPRMVDGIGISFSLFHQGLFVVSYCVWLLLLPLRIMMRLLGE